MPTGSQRRNRASDCSRRSEQAYAHVQRRSNVTNPGVGGLGGRRSVALPRGSVASVLTTPWPDDDDLEEMEDVSALDWEVSGAEHARRKRRLWCSVGVPFLISLAFIIGGVLYLVYGSDKMINNLQIWRLCFFIGGLPFVWWIGTAVTMAAVWCVEKSMFRVQNALYFAYAVRVSDMAL